MQNLLFIGLSFLLLISNWIIAYYIPPYGIFLTPVFISIITILISVEKILYSLFEIKNTLKAIWKSLFSTFFICIQDVGLNIYAGGTHDAAGKAIIFLFFICGLGQGIAIITTGLFIDKKHSLKSKIISLVIFIALLGIYTFLIR